MDLDNKSTNQSCAFIFNLLLSFLFLQTLQTVNSTLTEEEITRNTRGESLLFAGRTHTVTISLHETFYSAEVQIKETDDLVWSELPADLIYGMAGLTASDINCHWLNLPVPAPYLTYELTYLNDKIDIIL